MEASTVSALESSTGSRTIADLLPRAAEKHGERIAVRHKRGGEWHDHSYAEVGDIVREVALGLIDLGLTPGDRVAILCNTRPEWTYADFAISTAGGVVVPVYPTNSPEECEWVVGNSGARAVVCEDAEQVAKIAEVRARLPELQTVVVVDPAGVDGDAIALDEVRARGRSGDRDELERRSANVTPDDPFTIIYTSGTTGPPKGCVLSHGNYRAIVGMAEAAAALEEEEVLYLYLPLAHSFALLMQLLSFDMGGTIAYFGGDTKQIVAELSEVRPTFLPSVPRIFEKIYTLATAALEKASSEERTQFEQAVELGVRVREKQRRGEPVSEDEQRAFAAADERLFKDVRAIFGGRVRQCLTGAAPIAPEILEFFYACGVPVLEGYGMTETSTGSTISTLEHFKFGTVGRPLPGVEIRIADDGEVLLRGANMFQGYWANEEATAETLVDGWLHTGDVGEVDDEGFLRITGRKKDIIITAGGKNLTPANLENDLKQSRWISQAVMYGDRRPYPVALITLDDEEMAKWAPEHGLPAEAATLSRAPEVLELIQGELDRVNRRYAQVEQIKRFKILDHDLSQETGELTPTLKVKRNVVYDKYADDIASLY